MRVAVATLLLLAATALHAENDCSSMLRTMTHFRGTVRSLETAATTKLEATPVDIDPLFVAVIGVDDGQHLILGIHSLSRTFGTRKVTGRAFDLDAERMDCDGKFRRFISLQKHLAHPIVETFDGWLDVGHTYRAKATWTADGLALTKRLELPMHHDGGLSFTNADSFALTKDLHEVVFEVTSVTIKQIREWEWLSMFDARIVEVH